MESQYQRRTSSREPIRGDSNRFLTYSRLRPRPASNPRTPEDPPRATAIDARLATVYDKMKSNPYAVLTAYSEDLHPGLAKSSAWKETVNEIEKDSHRVTSKGGFSQVVELLGKFQGEIFEILKIAKRTDEINMKAKLWEVFNSLSNSLWTNFFKSRPDEKDLVQENRLLKNSLDRMEEQMLKFKSQLHEKDRELASSPTGDFYSATLEVKNLKAHSRELQADLANKISIIQSQEQQISLMRHELRSKDQESDRRSNPRLLEELRDKLGKITQERDGLRDWKAKFTQYPSTYEKAIQRLKEEHLNEKYRLQGSIEQLQGLIERGSPRAAKTTIGFYSQGIDKEARSRDNGARAYENELRLNETISILKRENVDLKEQLEMIMGDYEEVCNKFKVQSEQLERVKVEHAKGVESLKEQVWELQGDSEESVGRPGRMKIGGLNRRKKEVVRAGKASKQGDDRELMINDIKALEHEKLELMEEKNKLEEVVRNDEDRINQLIEKMEEYKGIIEEMEKEKESQVKLQYVGDDEKLGKEKSKIIEILKKNIAEQQDMLNRSEQKTGELNDQMRDIEETNEILLKSLKDKEKRIESLEESRKSRNIENQKMKDKIAELSTQYAADKTEINMLEKEIAELSDTLNAKTEEFNLLENDFKKMRIEMMEQFKKSSEEKDDLIKKLQKSLIGLETENNKLKSAIETLKENNENVGNNAFQQSLLESTERNRVLEKKVSELEDLINELDNKLNYSEELLKSEKISMKDLCERIQEVEHANFEMVEKKRTFEEQLDDLKKKLHFSEQQFEREKANSNELYEETSELQRLNNQLVSQNDLLNKKLEISTKSLTLNSNEANNLMESKEIEILNLEKQISSQEEVINNLIKMNKMKESSSSLSLNKIIDDKDLLIQSIRSELQESNRELTEIKKIIQEKSLFISRINQELSESNEKLSEMEQIIADKNLYIARATKDSQELQKLLGAIDDKNLIIARLSQESKKFSGIIDDKTLFIARISQEFKESQTISELFGDKNLFIARISQELRESNKKLSEIQEILNDKDLFIARSNQELQESIRFSLNNNDKNLFIARISQELKEINQKLFEAQEFICDKNLFITRIDQEMRKATGRIAELEEIIKDKNLFIDRASQEIRELKGSAEEIIGDKNVFISRISQELRDSNENAREMQRIIDDKNVFISRMSQELREGKKIFESLEDKNLFIQRISQEQRYSTAIINEKNLFISRISQEIQELKKKLSEIQTSHNLSSSLPEIDKEALCKIQQQLLDKESEIELLQTERVHLMSQVEQFTRNLDSLESNFVNRSSENQESEIEAKNEQIQNLEIELSRKLKELEKSNLAWTEDKTLETKLLSQIKELTQLNEARTKSHHQTIEQGNKIEEDINHKDLLIEELMASKQELLQKVNDINKHGISTERENMKLQNEIDTLIQEKIQLQDQFKKLRETTVKKSVIEEATETIEALYREIKEKDEK